MEMTPAQKQEFLARKKLQQKREAEIEAAKKDPKTLIIDRKEPICKAYLENKQHRNEEKQQQASTEASETGTKPEKSGPVVTSLRQEKKRQIKEILGEAGESLAFQQTLQWTFQQYHKMNKVYENEQMKEKIKIRGSLYGVPSTEFS